jgi:DNA-binding MarR family transcriptional regulator
MDLGLVRKFRENIRHVERELNIQGNANCCEGVTLSQCHTLLELQLHKKSISLNDLSDRLYLDKSTVSRTVDSLVRKGTVNRDVPKENRRKVTISLTEKGKDICRRINHDSDAFFWDIIRAIPAKDLPVFLRSFETMAIKMIQLNKEKEAAC